MTNPLSATFREEPITPWPYQIPDLAGAALVTGGLVMTAGTAQAIPVIGLALLFAVVRVLVCVECGFDAALLRPTLEPWPTG